MRPLFAPSKKLLKELKDKDLREIMVMVPSDFGGMFSQQFNDYARANDRSYVMLSFPKGKPEQVMPDGANCSNKDFDAVIKHIYEFNKLGGK